jgi:hypothetical protein
LNHLCYSLGFPFGTDEKFSKPSLKYKFCKKTTGGTYLLTKAILQTAPGNNIRN